MKTQLTSLPEEIIRLVAIALSHNHGSGISSYPPDSAIVPYSCPPKDLLNLALSCKYLFDIVYPVLWRTIVIQQSKSLSPLPQYLLDFNLFVNSLHQLSSPSNNILPIPPNYLPESNDHQPYIHTHSYGTPASLNTQLDILPLRNNNNDYYYLRANHNLTSLEIPNTTATTHTSSQNFTNVSAPWPIQNAQIQTHIHGNTNPSSQLSSTSYTGSQLSFSADSPAVSNSFQQVSSHESSVHLDPRYQLVKFRWPDRWLYSPKASNLTSAPTDPYSRPIPQGHMDLTTPLEDGFTGVRRRRTKSSKHSSRDSNSSRSHHSHPKSAPSAIQDNSDMVPQYVVNGPKLVNSYINGTATQTCLDSIRKIKIPLDGTVGSIFGPDFDISKFRNSNLKPLANLQFVEICDEPGFQGLPLDHHNSSSNTDTHQPNDQNTESLNDQTASGNNSPNRSHPPSVSSPSTVDEDYFTEQGRVASFLSCITSEYTRIQISSTVVSTLTRLDSFELLSRICVLDIAVQFYELPRDEINFAEETQSDSEPLAIKVTHEGIWFLDVALRQMCNLETLALTDRIVSPSSGNDDGTGGNHFNQGDVMMTDDQHTANLPSPEAVSSQISPVIVPIWQALISSSVFSKNSSASQPPLSKLKELTLPNCFCQFITPELIPSSVEVLTLNTFFPALFTSRFVTSPPASAGPSSFAGPTPFQTSNTNNSVNSDTNTPSPNTVPTSTSSVHESYFGSYYPLSVSKLALNVGYEGIKLAFPHVLASSSNSSAASAAAAVQVIPVTPSSSPNESGSESSYPSFRPSSSHSDARQSHSNNHESSPQLLSVSTKPWTSELTALQIWMPPWLQNNNATGGMNIFDRSHADNDENNERDENDTQNSNNTNPANSFEPASNTRNPFLPPSPIFPQNPQLSSAANTARNIPRGRISLGDVFLQQVTLPLLSPKLVYLVLSSLPISLLESLPDYCPNLEVLLIENWDYASQTPVSRIINSSNYHVYYTDDNEDDPTKRPRRELSFNENGDGYDDMYFSDDSQDDYSDENDDYDEEDGDMYSDEEGEEDDYDNGKTYTLTVGFVTQRLDAFLAAATASGRADLPRAYEVYQTLWRQFVGPPQPSDVFTLDYSGYNAFLESVNALDVIQSLFASEEDLDEEAGDENEDGTENVPIEHGFAVGVTRHDLVNATAVSDTAAAMFLSMARIHYLSEEEIANLNSASIERGAVGVSGFDNTSVGPASIAQSTTSMVQFHHTDAAPQPLTTVSSPSIGAPRAPSVDASGSENTASSSSSRKRRRAATFVDENDSFSSANLVSSTKTAAMGHENVGENRNMAELGKSNNPDEEPVSKRRRFSTYSKSGKQADFLSFLTKNVGAVWSSNKSIYKVLKKLTNGNSGLFGIGSTHPRSRTSFSSSFGSARFKKEKMQNIFNESLFKSWLDSRFKYEMPDRRSLSDSIGSFGLSLSSGQSDGNANQSRQSRDTQFEHESFSEEARFENGSQRPQETQELGSFGSNNSQESTANQTANALASATALASAEAYGRIQIQNAEDQQSLLRLNRSLVDLVKKCGKTLQFVYLPIDPNTIHAATLSFMLCYCMLSQRKEKQVDIKQNRQQRNTESNISFDENFEMDTSNPENTNPIDSIPSQDDSIGLRLYLKYPIRQPAKLIRTGMDLTENDLDAFPSSSFSCCSSAVASPIVESLPSDSFKSKPKAESNVCQTRGENEEVQPLQEHNEAPHFPMTEEQLRKCVKRGTGMSPALFKDMSQSLCDLLCVSKPFVDDSKLRNDFSFSCNFSLSSDESPFKLRQDTFSSNQANTEPGYIRCSETDTFAMAKLLAATDPYLTPLESCRVSSQFSAYQPTQMRFGHGRNHSLDSNDGETEYKKNGSGTEKELFQEFPTLQPQVQHESYPLFKVYEYLVKTHSPALNNCIYRVTI